MQKQYLTNNREYFPMSAQEMGSSSLSNEETLDLWSKLDSVEEGMKARLLDAETPDKIYKLAESLHISKEKVASISVAIRDIGLGTLRESDVSNRLREKLPELSQEALQSIQKFIREFFSSSWKPSEYKEDFILGGGDAQGTTSKTTQNMPLLDAMRKFPRLGQQRITSKELQMRGSRDAVSPSIKNWITIYQQETGPAPHEAFERSNFLFHNANAVALSQEERNILHELLSSLDDNTPLAVETATQKIQFSGTGTAMRFEKKTPSNIAKKGLRFESEASPEPPDILNARFSKPQTMPNKHIQPVSLRKPDLSIESETKKVTPQSRVVSPSESIAYSEMGEVKPLTPAFSHPSGKPSIPSQISTSQQSQLSRLFSPSQQKPLPSLSTKKQVLLVEGKDVRQISTSPSSFIAKQAVPEKSKISRKSTSQSSEPHGLRISNPTANIRFSSSQIFPGEKKEE